MRADDPRDLADLLGPGNLQQEIEAVHDVGFDLGALVGTEASLRNGKIADFLRCKYRPLDSSWIVIGLPGDFKEPVKFSLWKDGWLIGLQNDLESVLHLDSAETKFLFEGRDAGQRFRPVQLHQNPDFFPLHADFQF